MTVERLMLSQAEAAASKRRGPRRQLLPRDIPLVAL